MTTCDQHGKLSNKLSWVLGILTFGAIMVTIGMAVQAYTIGKVDEGNKEIANCRVDIATLKAEVKIIGRGRSETGGSVIAQANNVEQRF